MAAAPRRDRIQGLPPEREDAAEHQELRHHQRRYEPDADAIGVGFAVKVIAGGQRKDDHSNEGEPDNSEATSAKARAPRTFSPA